MNATLGANRANDEVVVSARSARFNVHSTVEEVAREKNARGALLTTKEERLRIIQQIIQQT